jgi:membrane protease YdiL (CAAX protease family)
MLPKLRDQYTFIISALIVGFVHGVWHLPLHFLEGTVQINIPIYEFIIITVLLSISYSFIYEYTKNIKPMIVLHWMSNLSSAIFMYWVDGFGRYTLLVLTIIMNITLLYILRKNNKVKT